MAAKLTRNQKIALGAVGVGAAAGIALALLGADDLDAIGRATMTGVKIGTKVARSRESDWMGALGALANRLLEPQQPIGVTDPSRPIP